MPDNVVIAPLTPNIVEDSAAPIVVPVIVVIFADVPVSRVITALLLLRLVIVALVKLVLPMLRLVALRLVMVALVIVALLAKKIPILPDV